MLISDYLSSNIMICILFLIWPRAEIEKYFRSIFGSNENFKICFRDLLTFKIEQQIIDIFKIADCSLQFVELVDVLPQALFHNLYFLAGKMALFQSKYEDFQIFYFFTKIETNIMTKVFGCMEKSIAS